MLKESLIFSGQGIKNIDSIEVEIKEKSKIAIHLDISNNYLEDFKIKVNFLQLQILILDYNNLSTLKNFPSIKTIDTLSVVQNNFKDILEFVMNIIEKFPKLKLLNTSRNPMNPGFENYDRYVHYRNLVKKHKEVQCLDGLDLYDDSGIQPYKYVLKSRAEDDFRPNVGSKESWPIDELDENDLNNLIKKKKRQSSISYSQRMLRKADNLTKFNRKNHSEGNKHITNNDL